MRPLEVRAHAPVIRAAVADADADAGATGHKTRDALISCSARARQEPTRLPEKIPHKQKN